jgi:hypothetical protein
MIKKFEEYIEEALWKGVIDRSKSNDKRLEDGKKVMTSLGTEAIIKDPDCEYEVYIKDLLNTVDKSEEFQISILRLQDYGPDEQKNIIKGSCDYDYKITDERNLSIVAGFPSYNDLQEMTYTSYGDDICEEDYISVCHAVGTKLQETVISKSNEDKKFYFELIDEDTTWNYMSQQHDSEDEDNYYDNPLDAFIECFGEKFPDVELHYWSFAGYGFNIGIEIDYDNILIYNECVEFTEDFFEA